MTRAPLEPVKTRLPDGMGLVLIGRNEGERLKRALRHLGPSVERTVYVDSGSTDGSPEFARGMGYDAFVLDDSRPFTAARGRNAGLAHLVAADPDLELVHFLDGDCLLAPTWLETARAAFEADPKLALVTGHLDEMRPDASIYNKLCDLEWDGPVGEIGACGGIATMRVRAFQEANGFNETLIAGEEADLHIRMRANGWKLVRIDAPMAQHDAELTEFSQWWKRSVRAGHACAEGAHLHGEGPDHHQVRERRSNWVLGLGVPVASLALAAPTLGLSLSLGALYPLVYSRVIKSELARGRTLTEAELYARFVILGKVPQALGQLTFELNRLRGKKAGLYEYKHGAKE